MLIELLWLFLLLVLCLEQLVDLFIGIYYRGLTFDMGWLYGLNAFMQQSLVGLVQFQEQMFGGLLLLGLFNAMISGYISNQLGWDFLHLFFDCNLIIKPTGILVKTAEKV